MKNDFSTVAEHLKNGYSNAQSIIRFLDTKAALLISLSTVILGAGIKYLSGTTITYPWALFIGFLILLLSIVFALLCVLARGPKNCAATLLFPYIKNEEDVPEIYTDPTFSAISEDEVLKEYNEQIRQVGIIVAKKATWLKRAIIIFGLFLIFVIVFIGFELNTKAPISSESTPVNEILINKGTK